MNFQNKKICIAILAGGLSLRMGGGIKSLQKFNNKTIFDRILEKISPQAKNIIINSNKKIKKFDNYDLPIIQDKLSGNLGPLAGIHAALYWIKNNTPEIDWLVTVPSDTPFLPLDLINKLYVKSMKNNKIVLATYNKKIHPVIGLWKSDLIDDLEKNIIDGTRKIMFWVKCHNYETQNFDQSLYDPFFNINNKEDLIEAKKIEDKYIL